MNIFRTRGRKEAGLDAEIRSHLEEAINERNERGETLEEARANALREFGNIGLVKEVTRDMWGPRVFERLAQDLRFAVRSIRRHALLSLAVTLTLILGIGISTGVFSWFNALFLRARIDKDYDTFVRVYAAYTDDPTRFVIPRSITLEDYLAFRDGAKSVRTLTALAGVTAPFGQDDPAVTRAALVSCNFFELYDPGRPLFGRLLQSEDCAAASPVVVLSEHMWRLRFSADPQVVGHVTHFNGKPVTIVGVTKNFAGMVNGARAWFPLSLESYLKAGAHLQYPGEAPWVDVTAHLQPGFTYEQAAAELGLMASAQNRRHQGRSTKVFVTDGSDIREPVHGRQLVGGLVLILGALTVFVLIVCVNVTALLLARAAARQQEIAVRVALGAGRLRLIRMLLVETLLLAAVAGLASVYLSYKLPGMLEHWLTNARGEGGGTWYSLAPDWRVFGYLALATILAGVVAGLTPALQSLKVNLMEMLKGRQSMPSGGKGSRLYGILIGAQVALSMFLVAGAFLFIRTSQKAAGFAPGFEPQRVLVAQAHPPENSAENLAENSDRHSWGGFHRNMTERLTNLPGVQSVAWAYWSPVYVGIGGMNVQAPGQPMRRTAVNTVSADYFATLGIPMLSGRALRQDDQPCDKGPCSIVVSERLARSFWPDEQPLGKTLKTERGNTYEVVGVVRDLSSTRLGGLDDPIFYRPWNQDGHEPANAFVQFAGSEAAITRDVIETYRANAPELPVEATTLQSLREHNIESMNRMTRLVVFLCAIAVILALAGIYGVVAFAVSHRTKEMGIRLALGARPSDIYRAVLGSSGRPVAVGLVIGLALTTGAFFGLAQLVRNNKEFDIDVWDPLIFVCATVLLIVASSIAMFGPAKRATKVDPLVALRDE